MICTTLLNPSFDLVYSVSSMDKTTYLDVPSRFFPAGKGVNFAKVVATLGEEVAVYSLMPEQDCSRFTDYLESKNIHHNSYCIDGSVRINTTVFDTKTKSTIHYNSLSQQLSPQKQYHFEQFLHESISTNDHWVFTGSLPPGVDADFYEKIIAYTNENAASSILDSRGEPFERALRSKPMIVTPNEDELEELFSEPVHGIHQLALKGKRLIDLGVETAFVTLGSDGVLALTKDECLLCKAPDVTDVDTVGCGDAFLGGVTVGMIRDFSFHEICRLAVACGASNASHIGPGEIEQDQVWHLMEQVEVVSL